MQLEGLVSELQESSCLYFPALGLQTHAFMLGFFFFFINSEDQTHSLAFAWQVLYQLSCVLARHLTSLCNSSVIISRMILCFAKYMLY